MADPAPPPPPPALLAKAWQFRWQCSCGAKQQKIRLDKHGRPYASCAPCGRIIFWKDPEKFYPWAEIGQRAR